MIETGINQLREDLKEFQSLLEKCKRERSKVLFQKHIEELTEHIALEDAKTHEPSKIDPSLAKIKKKDDIFWQQVESYLSEDGGMIFKVTVSLDDIGEVDKNNITCDFKDRSLDLKIKGYKGRNLRLLVEKLNDEIIPNQCQVKTTNNSVRLLIQKKNPGLWSQLTFRDLQYKFEGCSTSKDNGENTVNMFKYLYEKGDDQMKQLIEQSYVKVVERKQKLAAEKKDYQIIEQKETRSAFELSLEVFAIHLPLSLHVFCCSSLIYHNHAKRYEHYLQD
eukprot:TRINITY_DN8301_c0_g2_i7.p1 TRINITY_DN8301_c0_g2~~TRINITY_DN8301_c0_g2_i7.p1  ORF type:complete len:277 (+),score=64.32 TRINITY_DN8301_c0_g2_i7:141-971(+)